MSDPANRMTKVVNSATASSPGEESCIAVAALGIHWRAWLTSSKRGNYRQSRRPQRRFPLSEDLTRDMIWIVRLDQIVTEGIS